MNGSHESCSSGDDEYDTVLVMYAFCGILKMHVWCDGTTYILYIWYMYVIPVYIQFGSFNGLYNFC